MSESNETVQREWKVIFTDYKTGGIRDLNNCKYFDTESEVSLEHYVPRKGEYIVSGDYGSDVEKRKCFVVLDVFWNLTRKDIDVYVKEVEKGIYPMHQPYL
jgi:hypothetical protein